ncbi:hypothetical protein FB451DRAFT_1385258 [Mycena latifolia]|nr:hypothetical protein FB451DRAFT_1385258 [Mycena latifolia]
MWEDAANAQGGDHEENPALLDRAGTSLPWRSWVRSSRRPRSLRSKDDVERLNAIGKKLVNLLDVSEAPSSSTDDRPLPNKFLSVQAMPVASCRPVRAVRLQAMRRRVPHRADARKRGARQPLAALASASAAARSGAKMNDRGVLRPDSNQPTIVKFLNTYWSKPSGDTPRALPSIGLSYLGRAETTLFTDILFSIAPEFPGATPEPFTPEATATLVAAEWKKLSNFEILEVPSFLSQGKSSPEYENVDYVVVFKEYELLQDFVENGPQHNFIHIVGSPGIGKSFSLLYLLVCRMRAQEATIWSRGTTSYYFGSDRDGPQVYVSHDSPNGSRAAAWEAKGRSAHPPLPDCILVDSSTSGSPFPEFWKDFERVVWASTAPDYICFEGLARRFVMNPPTVAETIAAVIYNYNWEQRYRTMFFTGIDGFQELLQTFGPSPGTIFAARNKPTQKEEIMAHITERMWSVPWDVNVRLVCCEDPTIGDISRLPPRAITLVRKLTYTGDEAGDHIPNIHHLHEIECIWSSLAMRTILWNIAKQQRSEVLRLHRYQTNRGDPNAGVPIGSCWEALALDFLNGRHDFQCSTSRLLEAKGTNGNKKYGSKGPATFYDYNPDPAARTVTSAPNASCLRPFIVTARGDITTEVDDLSAAEGHDSAASGELSGDLTSVDPNELKA